MAHIQQGLGAVQSIGQKLYHPYHLALLAEAYGLAGQPEVGLPVLDEALTLVEATEERWWEAEVYRLRGAVPPALSQISLGESLFPPGPRRGRKRQRPRRWSYAPRSSLEPAVAAGQRSGDQAQRLLTEVYSWFTRACESLTARGQAALEGPRGPRTLINSFDARVPRQSRGILYLHGRPRRNASVPRCARAIFPSIMARSFMASRWLWS